jgi:hypothetical protein
MYALSVSLIMKNKGIGPEEIFKTRIPRTVPLIQPSWMWVDK